eukprot:m.372476 g.372476  ORF g.372476 m.372476 type:complete len:53 (+) comp19994_c0_seq25:217-375(+)
MRFKIYDWLFGRNTPTPPPMHTHTQLAGTRLQYDNSMYHFIYEQQVRAAAPP